MIRWLSTWLVILGAPACSKSRAPQPSKAPPSATSSDTGEASLPLVLVAEVDLPGKPARFDYQAFDAATENLVIAHMNAGSVVIVRAADGSLVREVTGIRTPRGIAVADDAGRIFVTSMPNTLVILDNTSFDEIARVETGTAPDGVAWDPGDRVVGVSDQRDGAVSLIADAGDGPRRQVRVGRETGNVAFDATRRRFWVTAVKDAGANQLVSIDPISAEVDASIPLPGCDGAHGLRIHPDARSALVACEDNSKVVRVGLGGDHAVQLADCGANPDVVSIDPGLGWFYVAAESGDLAVFDLEKPGLVAIDREHIADGAHSVAVDPKSHHVFFPLAAGAGGTPALRIMKPAGL